jgi:subtilisin family serine protease
MAGKRVTVCVSIMLVLSLAGGSLISPVTAAQSTSPTGITDTTIATQTTSTETTDTTTPVQNDSTDETASTADTDSSGNNVDRGLKTIARAKQQAGSQSTGDNEPVNVELIKRTYRIDSLDTVDVLVELEDVPEVESSTSYKQAELKASQSPSVQLIKQKIKQKTGVSINQMNYMLFANRIAVRGVPAERVVSIGDISGVKHVDNGMTPVSSNDDNGSELMNRSDSGNSDSTDDRISSQAQDYQGPDNYGTGEQQGINSEVLTENNIVTGENVKVGIIDTGADHSNFNQDIAGFQDVTDGSINDNDQINEPDDEPGIGHGTHVTGIVNQAAPNASLYVASTYNRTQGSILNIAEAIQWLLQNDVDVISQSQGVPNLATVEGDGTSSIAEMAEAASQGEYQNNQITDPTLYVVSAGNAADNHDGARTNPDGSATTHNLYLTGGPGTVERVYLYHPANQGSADLEVEAPDGTVLSNSQPLGNNPRTPSGREGEIISISNPDQYYSGNPLSNPFTVRVSGANSEFEYELYTNQNSGFEGPPSNQNDPTESITPPATAPSVLTVGAVDSAGDVTSFSSQGPTLDGRPKPEIVAPGDDIQSTLNAPGIQEQYAGYDGTSMAAPHVSGTAALYIQMYRKVHGQDPSPEQVRAALMAGAVDPSTDKLSSSHSSATGVGRVDAYNTYLSFTSTDTVLSTILPGSQNVVLSTTVPASASPAGNEQKGVVFHREQQNTIDLSVDGSPANEPGTLSIGSTSAAPGSDVSFTVDPQSVLFGGEWAFATLTPPKEQRINQRQFSAYEVSDPASLDSNESAAYALGVNSNPPNGQFVGDHGAIRALSYTGSGDVNISIYDPTGTVDSRSTLGGVNAEQAISSDQSPSRVVFPPSTQPAPVSGEWKVVYTENSSSGGATFSPAVNYPMEPLPSEASLVPSESNLDAGNASDPGKINITLTVETANQPYSFQGFGAPDRSHFDITVGVRSIDSKNITVKQRNREDKYSLIAPVPKQPDSGEYNLTVEFTDTKLNASHTATLDDANVTYTSGGTATGRTATSLIVDDSGSMSGRKIKDAKDAGREYVKTVDDSAAVGVARFASGASAAHPMVIVANNESSLETAIRGLNAGGSTNIGGGMQVGRSLLSNAPGNATKAAILLSDGNQNTGPNPQQVAKNYNNSDIPVYTIALGGGADDATLRSIAQTTGGTFYQTLDSSTLGNIYNDIRTTVSQSSTFHTASGTLTQNNQTTNSFGVGGGVDSTNVRVQLGSSASGSTIQAVQADAGVGAQQTQSGKPTVRLQYPNGTTVNYNTTGEVTVVNPGIDYVSIGDTVVYQLNDPQQGNWSYTIVNNQSSQLDYSAQVTGSAIASLSTSTDASRYVTGSTATLSTSLVGDTGGVSGATVTANVTLPDGNTTTVLLTEQTAGRYTADIPVTQLGAYQATITARAGSLSRQQQVQWTAVSQSSILSVNQTVSGTTPSARQGGQVSTTVNLSRPTTTTGSISGLGAAGPSADAESTEFEQAVAELAASDTGTYNESAVDPEVRQAAEAVRDRGVNVSNLGRVSAQSAGSSGTVAAYLAVSDLTGPNGDTIGQSRIFLSSTVIRLSSGEQQQLSVRVRLPQSVTPGTYTGELTAYVSGTAVTERISINVTQATRQTYRVRIQQSAAQWETSGPAGKEFYEEQIADSLTQIYYNDTARGSSSGRTSEQTVSESSVETSSRHVRRVDESVLLESRLRSSSAGGYP